MTQPDAVFAGDSSVLQAANVQLAIAGLIAKLSGFFAAYDQRHCPGVIARARADEYAVIALSASTAAPRRAKRA